MRFQLFRTTYCRLFSVRNVLMRGYCSPTCKPGEIILKRSGTVQKSSEVSVKPLENEVKVDEQTLQLLERLSLVKCDTAEGVKVLEESIAFANKILHVDTTDVEPMYTVLENQDLMLRPDIVTEGNCQKDILKNASVTEEGYFVAPPGNIPLHEVGDIPLEEN